MRGAATQVRRRVTIYLKVDERRSTPTSVRDGSGLHDQPGGRLHHDGDATDKTLNEVLQLGTGT